ncbi:helix-turn-helix domain-containing protein [Halobacterium rubrum]|uniref:helix-turn-helix domain-containing protein n=1 Tax=Halobacterium TaxID=2239 RepID=UPI001F030E03|nr:MULTISPECIES: helix-turn-helix domain-containing protein [Halobacterium]MDH5020331.1 helix-turn-helix domain-containing protein [Halobacterium rubrum]
MPEDGGDGVTVYACPHCEGVALDDRHRECCGEPMEPVTVDAAKEPDLATLVTQVFGVSETGVDICVLLMERDEVTIEDIAAALDVNRTTASRQLTQLRSLGVIERREESLDDGGQRYVYTARHRRGATAAPRRTPRLGCRRDGTPRRVGRAEARSRRRAGAGKVVPQAGDECECWETRQYGEFVARELRNCVLAVFGAVTNAATVCRPELETPSVRLCGSGSYGRV